MNLAKRNTDDAAYLVCKGQEVVVEVDGCDRQCIILVVILRYQLQRSMKIDAHLPCSTGDIEIQRSGQFTHKRDKRKGTDIS